MKERIEFLLVWEDQTWDTRVFEVPEDGTIDDDYQLEVWFNGPTGPSTWSCYRQLIKAFVWNLDPDLDAPYEKLP